MRPLSAFFPSAVSAKHTAAPHLRSRAASPPPPSSSTSSDPSSATSSSSSGKHSRKWRPLSMLLPKQAHHAGGDRNMILASSPSLPVLPAPAGSPSPAADSVPAPLLPDSPACPSVVDRDVASPAEPAITPKVVSWFGEESVCASPAACDVPPLPEHDDGSSRREASVDDDAHAQTALEAVSVVGEDAEETRKGKKKRKKAYKKALKALKFSHGKKNSNPIVDEVVPAQVCSQLPPLAA
ncbi:hypothetical protein BDK51DRAFT_36575 [Blyttiomyces helicus]|uniref:Uncharacterized protein n=1 Tax=Blyttiomyces helicus TaxID=388810 RepID=A0A4P9WSY3_9FUNG|nr:hypothetical protein BDK51DRAFT_36575 [Blyttiomyces helicus]|eukprot:RKO94146.1 hypothetical protein BDK51DRAFT_36575 [Blyttiomyces helicus]